MKNAVITGASSGIGRQIALEFHRQGWTPHLVGRNQERLQQASQACGDSPYYSVDLATAEDCQSLVEQLSPYAINALVNNAGAYQPAPFPASDDENWNFHFTTNLMSAVRVTRGLWQNLITNKGAVLNISSTLGIRPIPSTSAYSALKAAMNNWTLSLALEGAPEGIRANAIGPGLVDTPIHAFHQSDDPQNKELHNQLQSLQPIGRMGQPEDIAPLAFHLCSDSSSWTTGTIINVDGGMLLKS